MNAVIAVAYFGIFAVIFRGLRRSGQLRTNRLGVATAAIFFSCGLGHLLHVDHLLAPSLGLAEAEQTRAGIDWHLALWDAVTAAVAYTYWGLRKSYGVLLQGPAMFDDLERRNSERAVRTAEQLFRTSFENTPIGMALVDLEGRFMRVNRSLCEMVGLDEDALLKLTFQEITHPDDLAADLEHLRALVAGETCSYSMEKRYIHADRSHAWAELHVSLVSDDDGRPVHLVAQIRDISAQKAAEAHLGRYLAVVEFAEDAVVATDLDGRILTWNRGAERLFGYDSEEAMAQSIVLLQPADRIEEIEAINDEIRAGRTVERLETRRRRSDGSLVDVQITVSPVRDATGKVVGGSTIARDVTAAVLAERARTLLERDLAKAHDSYAHVLAAATECAIIGTDSTGTITVFNTGAERMLGYGARELVGQRTPAVLHDADELAQRAEALGIEPGFEVLAATAREGGAETREWTYVRKDGARMPVSVTVTAQRERGVMTGFLAIATDITDVKRAEGARREAEELFRGAFEHAPIGVALVSTEGTTAGTIVRANRALADLVGGDPDALAGRGLTSLAPAEDRSGLIATLARLLAGAESVHGEQRLIAADGHDVWTLLSGSLVQGSDGRGRQAVIQVLDITERKTFEGRLQHLADHDALTGLVNRRRFEHELDRAIAHAERYGSKGAVLLLDLDGFKYINDALGHSVGDELIMRIAHVIRGTLRDTDLVARIGGDEFAAILPDADERTAAAVAEKLLSAIRRQGSVTTSSQRQARVTTSIGATVFDGRRGLTGEDLLVEADIAMYDAKDGGRDGVKVYRDEERSRERMNVRATWLERLRSAVADDRFRLFGQPILSFGDSGVPWFELLLRYEDDSGDLVPPGAFLSIAERFDLICEIDRWVLHEAVRMLHDEHAAGRDVALAVNLSGRTMSDPGLGEYLESLLAARPIQPGRLVIEVTETAAIVNVERARRLAERLHALGCRFALDDFGAGFASFYYLKHLAFDYLKIDGEFVRQIVHDPTDQLVIEAVVNIARGLGTRTVAEFVGDDETVELLRRLGVDYGQGYHLGMPEPIESLLPAAHASTRGT
ncbi:MAG TPA: PAS domain S-box protein [Solirubrobacteraceae bacterium]|nr:PAS domain S-box protein [Solirubrobacteraceae bacterium]